MNSHPRGLVLRHALAGIGGDDECFTLPVLRGFSVVWTPGDQALVGVVGGAIDDESGEQQTVYTFGFLPRTADIFGQAVLRPPIAAGATLPITPIAGIPALLAADGVMRLPWERIQSMRIQAEPVPPAFAPTKSRSICLLREAPTTDEILKGARSAQEVGLLRVFLDEDEASELALVLRRPNDA